MVERADINSLKHTLNKGQYGSADSSPPRLSHALPHLVAPQLILLFIIISAALTLAFNKVPAVVAAFPERDIYFTRYDGQSSLPLRLFLVSFYLAFTCFIEATRAAKTRAFLELALPFLLFCAAFDLCNVVAKNYVGIEVSLLAGCLTSALVGMLNFSIVLLNCADMPPRVDSPMQIRFKIVSLLTLGCAALVSAGASLWIDGHEALIVRELRDVGLLGGVSAGIFLFVPLMVFLLNIVAVLQHIGRSTKPFAPPVTLILPAYNEAHVAASAIAAVDAAAVRYPNNVTLFVVDNNSTDLTQQVVRDAFARAKHLTCSLLEEFRPGKAYALNRGLSEVRTDFFARVDADTLLTPDSLVRAMSYFGRKHVGAVGGLALPPGGGPFDGVREIEILLKQGYDQVALAAADCIFGIPGMFVCYDTEAVRRSGGFACEMNGEDTDIALRIGEDGYRLIVSPSVIFFSEVPRSYEHLREQRHRWFRSIYHVAARNRQLLGGPAFSVRGLVIVPFMLFNNARRAMAVPLLLYAGIFLIIDPDPRSTIRTVSVVALLLGVPALNAIIAILVNLRFKALLAFPPYLIFRMMRAYLTLETMLTMNFSGYAARCSQAAPPARTGAKTTDSDAEMRSPG